MKDCGAFQLKPVAHAWAVFIVAELIFTLRLAFVVPAVVISRSGSSQFSGFSTAVEASNSKDQSEKVEDSNFKEKSEKVGASNFKEN